MSEDMYYFTPEKAYVEFYNLQNTDQQKTIDDQSVQILGIKQQIRDTCKNLDSEALECGKIQDQNHILFCERTELLDQTEKQEEFNLHQQEKIQSTQNKIKKNLDTLNHLKERTIYVEQKRQDINDLKNDELNTLTTIYKENTTDYEVIKANLQTQLENKEGQYKFKKGQLKQAKLDLVQETLDKADAAADLARLKIKEGEAIQRHNEEKKSLTDQNEGKLKMMKQLHDFEKQRLHSDVDFVHDKLKKKDQAKFEAEQTHQKTKEQLEKHTVKVEKHYEQSLKNQNTAINIFQLKELEKDVNLAPSPPLSPYFKHIQELQQNLLINSYQTQKIAEEHQKQLILLQFTEEQKQNKSVEAEYYRQKAEDAEIQKKLHVQFRADEHLQNQQQLVSEKDFLRKSIDKTERDRFARQKEAEIARLQSEQAERQKYLELYEKQRQHEDAKRSISQEKDQILGYLVNATQDKQNKEQDLQYQQQQHEDSLLRKKLYTEGKNSYYESLREQIHAEKEFLKQSLSKAELEKHDKHLQALHAEKDKERIRYQKDMELALIEKQHETEKNMLKLSINSEKDDLQRQLYLKQFEVDYHRSK